MQLENLTLEDCKDIEYRGEIYSLIGKPILPFFDENPKIKEDSYFIDQSDDKIDCFTAKWLLKNDKFFLIDYSGGDYKFINIFKTQEPVIAEWYTGTLEMGLGNFTPNNSMGSYDNYLWLNIKDGIILEKKITKRFDYHPVIEFGRYKSKFFFEIIDGNIYFHTTSTVKKYIDDIFSFLFVNDFNYKIEVPFFKIEDREKELISTIRHSNCIEYFYTKKYIAIKTEEIWPEKWADDLSLFIEKILSSDFSKMRTLTKKGFENEEISKNSILKNPDIPYLNWAFKNVEFFSVPPSFLKQTFRIKILKTFKINRLNTSIFEYTPIVEELDYIFPQHILEINQQRFEMNHNVIFNNDLEIYSELIDKSILYDKFGYYLDENIQEKISEDYEDDYFEKETYEDYNGSYAQDQENLSDQFINDVFDGDPDLYWNID
jgi:hypothetical protein